MALGTLERRVEDTCKHQIRIRASTQVVLIMPIKDADIAGPDGWRLPVVSSTTPAPTIL